MKIDKLLISCFVVCCLFASNVFAAAELHGISFMKSTQGTTEVGQPCNASYYISNNVDTAGDTLEVTGLSDTIYAAGGNVVSGNILNHLNWTLSGGAYWDTVDEKIILPAGGSALSDYYSFYTVQIADYNLPSHILPDQATINWADLCDGDSDNCVTLPQTATASSATIVTAPPGAGVTVTKEVDCDIATVGKELIYTITVENTGDTVLNLQSATDSILDDTELANALIAVGADVLDIGEQQSVALIYTVLGADPDPLVNTVEIAYVDQYQQNASDTASVLVGIIAPDFTVTKQCLTQPLNGGSAVFDVVVTNTGDVDLAFTTDEAALSDVPEPFVVGVGGSMTLIITIPADGSQNVDNQITVTGSVGDVCIDDIIKTSNLATCYAEPTINVTKEAECDVAEVGTIITYTITVENQSTNVLTLVAAMDSLLGDISGQVGADCATLDPGEICSFTVDREILPSDPATLNNMVTLVYEDQWHVQAEDSDSAQIDVVHPGFTVTKTCTSDPIPNGGPATFEVVVANIGDVQLEFTTDEAAFSDVPEPFTLGVGAVITLNITVPADGTSDVINSITVIGNVAANPNCPIGPIIKTASDICSASSLNPDFMVQKTCLTDPVAGEANALFEINITNTGDVDLNFMINDPAAGIVDILVGPIAPSTSYITTAEVPADCVEGSVNNSVTVQAYYNGQPIQELKTATAVCYCENPIEGCSAAYWKNNPNCWCAVYVPYMLLADVFTALQAPNYANYSDSKCDFDQDTLMDALNYQGGADLPGAARSMLKEATAALLNACNVNLAYPLSDAMVIDIGNAALATEDIGSLLELQGVLIEWNEYGCPIDANCQRIEPEPVLGDITGEGVVDLEDLKILAEQWLQTPDIPSADIAPPPDGDGNVNMLDFVLLAENWMK